MFIFFNYLLFIKDYQNKSVYLMREIVYTYSFVAVIYIEMILTNRKSHNKGSIIAAINNLMVFINRVTL